MKVIISQQGSGTRIYSKHISGEVWPEPFCVEPAPSEKDARQYVKLMPNFRLMYNHLEEQPHLYELLEDAQIIHLYRDAGRTFLRKLAKYGGPYDRDDLIEHIEFVERMRDRVNKNFKNVQIVHYKDFIMDYKGEIKEYNHV